MEGGGPLAWYCMRGSDMLTPPSTRSAASFTPLLAPSAAMASATSLAWKAIGLGLGFG